MLLIRRGDRAPRGAVGGRAGGAALRRVLVLGGFAFAAWLAGAAPASAEALDQVSQVAGTVSEVGGAVAGENGVGADAAQAAEAVTATVRTTGATTAPEPAPPAPADITGVVTQAREHTENAVATVTGTGHLDLGHAEPSPSAESAPEEPESPDREAAPAGDRDPAADREPLRRAVPPSAAAPVQLARTAQWTLAVEQVREFAALPSPESEPAPSTVTAGPAQPQAGSPLLLFADHFTRLPETARLVALSPAGRHALAMVPQNPVDEPSFSPD
ncbi:hypothetical protein [Marinactinospora rubrisoli]|uniref:Uncharacterized protein n=1 Tax=Marinactinospora rubrisoli TaxID=2715399 RepID=A0ABW2KFK3_9ACTN